LVDDLLDFLCSPDDDLFSLEDNDDAWFSQNYGSNALAPYALSTTRTDIAPADPHQLCGTTLGYQPNVPAPDDFEFGPYAGLSETDQFTTTPALWPAEYDTDSVNTWSDLGFSHASYGNSVTPGLFDDTDVAMLFSCGPTAEGSAGYHSTLLASSFNTEETYDNATYDNTTYDNDTYDNVTYGNDTYDDDLTTTETDPSSSSEKCPITPQHDGLRGSLRTAKERFHCSVPGCSKSYGEGYGSKRSLRKHEMSRHTPGPATLCPYSDCERSRTGFKVAGSLPRHLRRKHGHRRR